MLKGSDYKSFCKQNGTIFDSDNFIGIPPAGLVYVPLDRITEFFKLCNNTDNEYVVVSALSDYGISLQSSESVYKDMLKWLQMLTGQIPDIKYEALVIPARCNIEECKLSDKYSVKMYSYTKATFDIVPHNVRHWFCTNMNVDLPRVTRIPFGLAEWSAPLIEAAKPALKEKKLYVNFQTNTIERFMLMRSLRNTEWCTVESGIPHQAYVDRVNTHKYVLCPEGNGYDTFRVMETLALGSIPVMLRSKWSECYENFPVIFLDKWENLCYDMGEPTGDFAGLDRNFWFQQIEEALDDC